MLLTEWKLKDALEVAREETLEEGIAIGKNEGRNEGIAIGEARGEARGRQEALENVFSLLEKGVSLADAKKKFGVQTA